MNEHKTGCLVCGEELIYLDSPEMMECSYCKSEFDSDVKCTAGHYICDSCHSMDADDLIKQYCEKSESEDPMEMALELMHHPKIKMHGPEHHYLVPAVLTAAYYNIRKDREIKARKLEVAKRRSEPILGGFCGTHGNCGAAVGTGIFISIITGSTPLHKEEWRLSNLMTADSLLTIANHGGPRCCKRNTYLAIIEAVKFIKEHFNVEMKINEAVKCEFNDLNRECLEDECPFYSDT